MFKHLVLHKPLAVLDLETTGTDTQTARIVEISILKVFPDGRHKHHTRRVNPGIPIPPEATAIHGIRDADVAREPQFEQIAAHVGSFLEGCDLCGFNLKKFDLRVSCTSNSSALSVPFSPEGRRKSSTRWKSSTPANAAISPPRFASIAAANTTALDAAAADVLATAEILDAMLDHYADLPRTVAGLEDQLKNSNAVDSAGHFVRVEGEIRFAFGKHRGQPLDAVARMKPDYLQWMLSQDFFEDTKAVVKAALRRIRRTIEIPVR